MSPKKKFNSALLRINGKVVKHAWVNTEHYSDESSDDYSDVSSDDYSDESDDEDGCAITYEIKELGKRVFKAAEEWKIRRIELMKKLYDKFDRVCKLAEQIEEKDDEFAELCGMSFNEFGRIVESYCNTQQQHAIVYRNMEAEEENEENERMELEADKRKSEEDEAQSDIQEVKSDLEEAKSEEDDTKSDAGDKNSDKEETESKKDPKAEDLDPELRDEQPKNQEIRFELEDTEPEDEEPSAKQEKSKPAVRNFKAEPPNPETETPKPKSETAKTKTEATKSKTETPKPKTKVNKKSTKKSKSTKKKRKSNVKDQDPSVLVSIGPNKTKVPECVLNNIDWSQPTAATRKLLMAIFDRETLAFHTLTGKPSPAFLECNRPTKDQLDPKKVADIIHIVTKRSNVHEKDVRGAITTKCADENKMFKQREKRKLSLAENKENSLTKSNPRRAGKCKNN